MSGRKRRMPLLPRVLCWLLAAGILLYGGIFAWICVQEGQVPTALKGTEAFDAIIVLGAQVKPDGTPNTQLAWRLDAALEAYQQHPVPLVVCGAQGADEPLPEAEAMKTYLAERGVPEEQILTDDASFNTSQNLKNAAALLSALPEVRSVLVVTSDYHVPRALALARDQGFDAIGLGSPCKPEYWWKNHGREALSWIKYWGVKYLHLPLE